MATFGPVQHRYRASSWARFHGSLVAIGVGLLVALQGFAAAGVGVTVGAVVLVVGALAASLTWRSPHVEERRGRLAVTDGVLRIDGLSKVTSATRTEVEREGDILWVKVFEGNGRHPTISVAAYSEEDAARLREALDTERPITTFRVAGISSWPGRLFFGLALFAVGAGGILGVMLGQVTWFFLTLLGLLLLRMPGSATIGADGIVVSFLGIETFVPFSDVVRVERDYGIVLHRTDGGTLRLRERLSEDAVDALMDRIERARAALLDTSLVERMLARGDRTEDVWRDGLRRLTSTGYRSVAVERDRLWEVYENPGADESARRGAAILLRVAASEEEQQRLVRIAESVVSPELRERLLEDEESEEKPRARRAVR